MRELTDLRRELRERRRRLTPNQRVTAALAVTEHLRALPGWPQARRVAGYWAVRGELPLLGLLAALPAEARYCLPVLRDDQTLHFAPWQPGAAIAPNRFGIPEPADTAQALPPECMDVVVLPLLGFTRCGARIGTGGGWYDRSFAFRKAAPAPPLLVGVAYACQQLDDDWTPRPWDVPLDAIATERELIVCTR